MTEREEGLDNVSESFPTLKKIAVAKENTRVDFIHSFIHSFKKYILALVGGLSRLEHSLDTPRLSVQSLVRARMRIIQRIINETTSQCFPLSQMNK